MISKKKIKAIMAKARMQKARVHIGMNGVTNSVIMLMRKAFNGVCVYPTPSDVVRVKVQSTFTGDLDAAIEHLSRESDSIFIGQERKWLTFWKPDDSVNPAE